MPGTFFFILCSRQFIYLGFPVTLNEMIPIKHFKNWSYNLKNTEYRVFYLKKVSIQSVLFENIINEIKLTSLTLKLYPNESIINSKQKNALVYNVFHLKILEFIK